MQLQYKLLFLQMRPKWQFYSGKMGLFNKIYFIYKQIRVITLDF